MQLQFVGCSRRQDATEKTDTALSKYDCICKAVIHLMLHRFRGRGRFSYVPWPNRGALGGNSYHIHFLTGLRY